MPSRFQCRYTPWFLVGLGWLPITVGILLALSIVIPYCIAIIIGHVNPGFPYISDSGTLPPESCIFGQLLNMAACLGFAAIYVRYKEIEFHGENYYSERLMKVNKAGLWVGIVACFGMSLVANFQVQNILPVHFIGAFLLFAPGSVYGFLQAWISYKMQPEHTPLIVCHIRLLLSIVIAVFFLLFGLLAVIFTPLSLALAGPGNHLIWPPDEKGYSEHVVSTSSEWIVAIAFLFYFFTFIREFQRVTIHAELKPCAYTNFLHHNIYPEPLDYDNSIDHLPTPQNA